jgi:hypothetical protein
MSDLAKNTIGLDRPFGEVANRLTSLLKILLVLIFSTIFFHCRIQNAPQQEKYVSVKLNDSLKFYDSIEVVILVGGDSAQVVGRPWSGHLSDPSSIPDFRLDDEESRKLTIRVRGFDSSGLMVFNTTISKENGTQIVVSQPLPEPSIQLISLTTTLGVLSPLFSPGQSAYVLNLTNAESTLTITAVSVEKKAVLSLGATALLSGVVSDVLAIPVGDFTITIQVSFAGKTGSYTVRTIRQSPQMVNPGDTSFINRITNGTYKPWVHRARLRINYKYAGLERGKILTNFPLLVRLNSKNFDFAQARAGGLDIRFTKISGEREIHEISRWDSVAGLAEIWVKMSQIVANDDSSSIYMYWGNRTASTTTDPDQVFNKGDGFAGVWHLSETATGQASDYAEATGYYPGRGGTGDGTHLPKRVAGVVGDGQDFKQDGYPGVITLPKGFDPGGNNKWSFQVWIKKRGIGLGVIFYKGTSWSAADQRVKIQVSAGAEKLLQVVREGDEFPTGIYIGETTFTYLNITYDSKLVSIYVDGFFRESKAWTQGGNANADVSIGSSITSGINENFDGVLDELWISSNTQSAEWVRMSYESQKIGSNLVQILPAP